jgi:5-methyltetrahydrofolate corrinoid/iron sulfur protein methyltransferase
MILIADNLHVINPIVARAIHTFDPEPIREIVRRCVQAGANAIDINSGPLPKDPEARFTFLVETVQAVTDLPLLLDTTNPKALEAGLSVAKNKPIINGFSLEPAKLEHILPLAKKFGTDIIGYLLNPDSSVPMGEGECLNVAMAIHTAALAAGLDNNQLIIDPIITPLSWENGIQHNRDLINVLRMLPDLLGFPVKTIAGVSNLTSGQGNKTKKRILETAYLPMLASAGLNMALLDILHDETVKVAKACNAMMGEKVFTWAEIG